MNVIIKIQIMFLFVLIGLASCQTSQNNEDEVKGIKPARLSDFVQNPVSADGIDTVNVAKINFETEVFDFGTVDEGDVVEYTFSFVNRGNQPLMISTANSTCGCTIPEWPKEAIGPGERSEIHVKFNTEGKVDRQIKPISIFANTYPNETKVYLKGIVLPKKQ